MSVKLTDLLPKPSNIDNDFSTTVTNDPWFRGHSTKLVTSIAVVTKEPPPYGKRNNFKPKDPEDFGDGGAFPEIHFAQFPLGMGIEIERNNTKSKTIALQYDEDGKLRHDAIARLGHGKDKIVHSKISDMKSKLIDEKDESFFKPTSEELDETTEETRKILEKIISSKVAAALPVQHAQKAESAQYVRYTPSQQSGLNAGGAQQRIIRLVTDQVDPMEPPQFKINQKIPRAPPSPPAPVMHSPPRKVSSKEQADWKIPPCISNYKNPKGFTVSLDKRLATDGRGLQQVHINENFSKLAEALSIAERKAREGVEIRGQMERRIAQNKKSEQEKKMREMAMNARIQRTAISKPDTKDEKDAEELKERDAIRRDRLDDHRKERNIARSRPDKLERIRRDKERDVSEKIALGLPDTRTRNGETQYDQRLFNQTSGLDSGGINDETYVIYDKPWRPQDSIQQHIYRPSKNVDSGIYGEDLDKIINTNRFVADKGFQGTEGNAPRSGPVQFERQEEEDIFGLGELLQTNNTKDSSKRKNLDDTAPVTLSTKKSRR